MRFTKLTRALSLAAILAAGATMTGGCADNRTSLVIMFVQAPDDNCEFEVSQDSDGYSRGRYDPSFGQGYRVQLLLGNGLQPLGDNDTLRAETSRIQLQGCEVSVASAQAQGASVASYTQPLAFIINPDDSEDLGLASVGVEIIPASIGVGLAAGTYIVTLRMFGTTLGGKKIESGEFAFPVDVGSLAWCVSSLDLGHSGGCLLGQDSPVHCLDYTEANGSPCDSCF